MSVIDRQVLLSFPSALPPLSLSDRSARSWIQIARTGAFVSNRYGEFAITREDLAQMLHNFRMVTPIAPTKLAVDYDHLSMDPKQVGDGTAAGWFQDLELRNDGDELWGLVEWTPKAAEHIKNLEYQFVSPSFVKDHTSKQGKKIGTTLLAAAITNHPFLEGMQAVTLYDLIAIRDSSSPEARTDAALRTHLQEVPTMTKNAAGELMSLANTLVKEQGLCLSDALKRASLQRPDLAEAHISGHGPQPLPLPLRTEDALSALANRIASDRRISLREAIPIAAAQDLSAVQQYQDRFNTGARTDR
jgi:phage I-like protein